MPSLHLRSRLETMSAIIAAATASVALLGGAAMLFDDAGRTPTFEPSSRFAQQAERCREAGSMDLQRQCLHELAAAAEADAALTAQSPYEPLLP
jgi:hypothetical protein